MTIVSTDDRLNRVLKYCECGCGKVVKEKNRFIKGHNTRGRLNHNYGKHLSEETKEKIRIAEKGKIVSNDTKIKMSAMRKGKNNPNYGKRHSFSDRAKQNMSKAHKGRFLGVEHFNWKGGTKLRWKRANDKRKNDLKYQLNSRITRSINSSLKKGTKNHYHWCKSVGYNVEQLKKRLESTMPQGYSWQDFLDGKLHVDHKVSISAHNFTSLQHLDFQRCWALSNLQLLPAHKNLSKHNKLFDHFQTCFQI